MKPELNDCNHYDEGDSRPISVCLIIFSYIKDTWYL